MGGWRQLRRQREKESERTDRRRREKTKSEMIMERKRRKRKQRRCSQRKKRVKREIASPNRTLESAGRSTASLASPLVEVTGQTGAQFGRIGQRRSKGGVCVCGGVDEGGIESGVAAFWPTPQRGSGRSGARSATDELVAPAAHAPAVRVWVIVPHVLRRAAYARETSVS